MIQKITYATSASSRILKRLTVRVPVVASKERSGLDKRTSWLSTLSDFKFADVVTLRSLTVTVLFTICKLSGDVKTSKPFHFQIIGLNAVRCEFAGSFIKFQILILIQYFLIIYSQIFGQDNSVLHLECIA